MRQALLVALLALALVGAGSTGDDAASTTTTSVVDTTITISTTTTTTLPATTTTLPPLVDTHSIGYGFLLVAADETAALSIEFTDHRAAAREEVPEVTVLPDPLWKAEVNIGHDLDLLWGPAGIVTPTDPRPVVDEVWTVVAGTITILEIEPAEVCHEARARLEDFEALTPTGQRVYLGNFEVETSGWGCFPV
jgi:hypothetical protein